MLFSIWTKISENGIDYAENASQAKKIRLVNQLTVSGIFLESFFILSWVAFGYNFALYGLLLIAIQFGVLYLTSIGKHYLSRFICLFGVINFIFFFSACSGRGSGIHLLLYIVVVAAFSFFQNNERTPLYILLATIFGFFLILEFCFFQFPPYLSLEKSFTEFIYYSHVVATFVAMILFLRILTKEAFIAENKLLEQNTTLEDTKEELEQALEVRSSFLSNMSHEIRTPLNAIIGFTDILRRDEQEVFNVENIRHIYNASNNLLHLVNDILDISKIESDNFQLHRETFSISEKLEEIKELLKNSAKHRNNELVFSNKRNYSRFVVGDSFRFNQILLNLLSNAIKFTKEGQVSCTVEKIYERNDIEHVQIQIKDTGIGIKKDHLESIFESFNQAQSSITKEYGGTGLGLAITKRLIQNMNGSIHVESSYGEGSTFTVILPFEKGTAPPENTSPQNIGQDLEVHNLNILLVDDNEMNLLLLSYLLKQNEKEPDLANNGQEALEKLKVNEYDLVLLDVQMPKISGFDVYEGMKRFSTTKNTKVVAITADVFDETREKAHQLGIDGLITKPFAKEYLYQVINGLFSEKR